MFVPTLPTAMPMFCCVLVADSQLWAMVLLGQGWPKLLFQVWQLDETGRADVCGYGYCSIPPGPGDYQVEQPYIL
jgi:hypothetical protein